MGDFSTFPGLGGSGVPADLINLGFPTSGGSVGGLAVADVGISSGGGVTGGGGTVGGFVFDPLAGLPSVDPSIYVTAPDLTTAPIDPTIGGAVNLSPTGGTSIASSTLPIPADTPIGSPGVIDPTTGLPAFTTTVLQGPTLSDLQNLPTTTQPTIPAYVPPVSATTGQPTSVTQLPISVFDPSQLPNVTIPTTPYGGILPPVQPPAPPAPGLFQKIGRAVGGALKGLTGGSAGGGTPPTTAPPRSPGTFPAGHAPPAGLLGGESLFPLLLIGVIGYLVFRKDGE